MLKLSGKLGNSKFAFASIVLMTNAFVWYFFVINILEGVISKMQIDLITTALIWSAHFGGIGFSAIIGAKFFGKTKNRFQYLVLWMVLGVIASFASLLIDKTSTLSVLILSLFLGISLGIGMPNCMGFFTESVKIEKRGSLGGIVLLLSGVTMFALGVISVDNIFLQTFILTAWRLFGLGAFLALKTGKQKIEVNQAPTYRTLLGHRPFILYLIPWIMFSLITYLTVPIQSSLVGKSDYALMAIIESAFGGIFSFAGGFFSDVLGRKRIAILGFALLGLGYSVLGMYPNELYSWYFYAIIDGVAWGLLYVLFVVVIWGDLSNNLASDKYYALGVLPFFISKFLQLSMGTNIAAAIPTSAIFSFTAFFLFLAVLPLIYAPETLPEKVMKDRDLKSYVEKAKKKAADEETEKQLKKGTGPPETADEEIGVLPEEIDREYEEAQKLAEKYY
jgi:MFS family permease